MLVVDDEPMMGEMLRRMLSSFDVDVAVGGESALEALDAREYDAVLCDLTMPFPAGPDVYAAICERWPHLQPRFAVMTGGAHTVEARLLFRTIPPERRLEKPFTARQAKDVLTACVENAPPTDESEP